MSSNKIGRNDNIDRVAISTMTVSGTPTLIPPTPLGGRTYIKVKNTGSTHPLDIVDSNTGEYGTGYYIENVEGVNIFADATRAPLYAVTASGTTTTLRVYERRSVLKKNS